MTWCDIPPAFIIGPIIGLGFLIGGTLSFAISAGIYSASKEDGFTYDTPPATVIAFHWVCIFCGVALGASICLIPKHRKAGGWLTGISLILMLSFYICYLIFFFSSEQFKKTHEAITLPELQTMWKQSLQICPYIGLTGSGSRLETHWYGGKAPKVEKRTCFTKEFQMESDEYCKDETTLSDIASAETIPSTGYRVSTDVSFVFSDEQSQSALDNAVADGMSELNDKKILVAAGIPGLNKVVLVTNDGKLPPLIGKPHGIAAGVLFSGIVYSYRVSMIPMLKQVIAKTNVTIDYKPSSPSDICDVMGTCP